MEKLALTGKGQEVDNGPHFSKELQSAMGWKGLNLFIAREAGKIGINWSNSSNWQGKWNNEFL